jgi:hypothetical protein
LPAGSWLVSRWKQRSMRWMAPTRHPFLRST